MLNQTSRFKMIKLRQFKYPLISSGYIFLNAVHGFSTWHHKNYITDNPNLRKRIIDPGFDSFVVEKHYNEFMDPAPERSCF